MQLVCHVVVRSCSLVDRAIARIKRRNDELGLTANALDGMVEAITKDPVAFFQIVGIRAVEMFTMFIVTTFGLAYSRNTLNWDPAVFLRIAIVIGAVSLFTIPTFAHLSDRFGRKPVYLTGAVIGLRGNYKQLNYDVFVGGPLDKPENFQTHHRTAGFNLTLSF